MRPLLRYHQSFYLLSNINFFASWCSPCRLEHKYLIKLASENKKFKTLGINFKDKKNNALSFLNELGDPYNFVAKDTDGKTSILFGIYGIPESILIDKDLIIRKKIIGPIDGKNRGAVFSFTMENIHPHDLGQALDQNGIAVRTGHHCAWPLMRALKVPATTRASLYFYNDFADVDALISGIYEAKEFFTAPRAKAKNL